MAWHYYIWLKYTLEVKTFNSREKISECMMMMTKKGSAKKGYLIWTHEWIESYLGKCFSKCFNGFVVFSTKKNFRSIFTADLVGTYFCFNHLKDRSESTLLSEVYFYKYSLEFFIAFVKRLMSHMYKEKRKLWLGMVVFYFYF